MNILVTGAFGNVGTSAVAELLQQGHAVRCFDLRTRVNQRAARKLGEKVDVVWGDLRRQEDLATAVTGQDVVVHLAFIIPKLSATGVDCESRPDWAYEVNVGGTGNLVEAMRGMARPPGLIFASSYHVYGRTQHQAPPRTVDDPLQPTEHYGRHKIECERIVQESGLRWSIFRLAATFPISMILDSGMFEVPLSNRMEYVHTRDVGLAIANGVSSDDVWSKILHIGGGPRCQYIYRHITDRILGAMGVGVLPEAAFTQTPFATDWLDTSESQRLLQYQQRDLDDYVEDMVKLIGYRRVLVRVFRPFVRLWLLSRSPCYRQTGEWWLKLWPAPHSVEAKS